MMEEQQLQKSLLKEYCNKENQEDLTKKKLNLMKY